MAGASKVARAAANGGSTAERGSERCAYGCCKQQRHGTPPGGQGGKEARTGADGVSTAATSSAARAADRPLQQHSSSRATRQASLTRPP